jgi:hypothetical protein
MRTETFLPFLALAAITMALSACTKEALQPQATDAAVAVEGAPKTLGRPFLSANRNLPDQATQVQFEVIDASTCSVLGYLYAVRPPNTGIGTPYSPINYTAYNPGSDFTATDVNLNSVTFGLCGTYVVRPSYLNSGNLDQLKVEFQDTGCNGNTFDPTILPSRTPMWQINTQTWAVGNQTPNAWVWSSTTYGFMSTVQSFPYSTCP